MTQSPTRSGFFVVAVARNCATIEALKRNGEMKMTSQQSTHQIAERLQSYSTESLKDAVVNLYKMDGEEALIAYQIGFEELNRRMGDEAFDAWLDSKNI